MAHNNGTHNNGTQQLISFFGLLDSQLLAIDGVRLFSSLGSEDAFFCGCKTLAKSKGEGTEGAAHSMRHI